MALKNSPLSLFRFMYHKEKSHGIKEVPQYYYLEQISEWFAIYREKDSTLHGYKQILFKNHEPNMYLVGLKSDGNIEKLYENIFYQIKKNESILLINNDLPLDFKDRILIKDNKNIIISKNEGDAELIKRWIKDCKISDNILASYKAHFVDELFTSLEIQFRWSNSIWEIYGLKIFFEFLAMHKTSTFCNEAIFNCVRKKFRDFEIKTVKDIYTIKLEENLSIISNLESINTHLNFTKKDIKISNRKFEMSGDIKISYELKHSILNGTVALGFLPCSTISIIIPRKLLQNDFFFTGYDYVKDNFFNLKLSEKWEENKFLLFSRTIDDDIIFSHYPKKFIMNIPIQI